MRTRSFIITFDYLVIGADHSWRATSYRTIDAANEQQARDAFKCDKPDVRILSVREA